MRDDDLDHILSSEADIVPSSGFAGSVMDAIQAQTSIPPPIPFPWKRAIPGFAGALALNGFGDLAMPQPGRCAMLVPERTVHRIKPLLDILQIQLKPGE